MASNAGLSSALEKKLEGLLERFDELQAILVSTSEGVPLLKALQKDHVIGSYEYAEAMFPAVFASAAEQIGKLKFGPVRSITAFYGSFVLVHLNQLPLVITLIASNTPSVGAVLALGTQLREALAPLKKCIDSPEG